MDVLKRKAHCISLLTTKWLHKGVCFNIIGSFKKKIFKRMICNGNYIERHLNVIQEKGKIVNVLGLAISNNNLCYCLLKNKIIKKIGIINIKKEINSYNEDYSNNKKKRKSLQHEQTEKKNLTYNCNHEDNPLSFNIKEILTILNFIKLHSEDGTVELSSKSTEYTECEMTNNTDTISSNSYDNNANVAYNNKEINETREKEERRKEEKKKEEWIIGIEKVNGKYEKNKTKEKILSILTYFLQPIYKCQIIYFCPKEARRSLSIKCNFELTNREIAYKYIKQKIPNFPSIEGNKDTNINYLFSDSYIIAFYTHRYYMQGLVKNNKTIFTYLEKEVRKNKSFNNILNTLKKTENNSCKQDLKEVLKDKIKKIVETETYKLVDRYIL